MTGNISSTALAWLLTYAIHSTVLLVLVWLRVVAQHLLRVRQGGKDELVGFIGIPRVAANNLFQTLDHAQRLCVAACGLARVLSRNRRRQFVISPGA